MRRLRNRGIKTAIFTNNGSHSIDILREKLDIDSYFDIIQTRHDIESPKPFPDGIIYILRQLDTRPENAVVVGGSIGDALASQRAGVNFLGVLTGHASENEMIDIGATLVLKSVRDIPVTMF